MWVATQTAAVTGEFGEPVKITAGQSRIHQAGHFLLKRYPNLWQKRSGSRADQARAVMLATPDGGFEMAGRGITKTRTAAATRTRTASTHRGTRVPEFGRCECEDCQAGESWAPPGPGSLGPVRVAPRRPAVDRSSTAPWDLTPKVPTSAPSRSTAYLARWDEQRLTMLRFASQRSGVETGGLLFGHLDRRRYKVEHVFGAGPKSRHQRDSYTPDYAHDDAAVKRMGAAGFEFLGAWHTEPRESSGEPSPGDVEFWRHLRQHYNTRQMLGVIVVPWDGGFRTYVHEAVSGQEPKFLAVI